MTERLGYQHVSDFLQDQTSGELAGWLAYLHVDDEVQTQRQALAILKAQSRVRTQPAKHLEDDEPVIDTTASDFAEKFKGFINAPGRRTVQR